MSSDTRRSVEYLAIALRATVHGVITATGVLALLVALAAALTDSSVADFYAEAFPTYRGAPHKAPVTVLSYVIFCAYVLFGSGVAVMARRKISREVRSRRSKPTANGAA